MLVGVGREGVDVVRSLLSTLREVWECFRYVTLCHVLVPVPVYMLDVYSV